MLYKNVRNFTLAVHNPVRQTIRYQLQLGTDEHGKIDILEMNGKNYRMYCVDLWSQEIEAIWRELYRLGYCDYDRNAL